MFLEYAIALITAMPEAPDLWTKFAFFSSMPPIAMTGFVDNLVSSLNFSIPIKLPPGWLFELKRVLRIFDQLF